MPVTIKKVAAKTIAAKKDRKSKASATSPASPPPIETMANYPGTVIEAAADAADVPKKAPTKNAPATVTVVLPFKAQSAAYVEAIHDDKVIWLSKTSLTSFEIADDMVTLEMPRPLARRRKLLAA